MKFIVALVFSLLALFATLTQARTIPVGGLETDSLANHGLLRRELYNTPDAAVAGSLQPTEISTYIVTINRLSAFDYSAKNKNIFKNKMASLNIPYTIEAEYTFLIYGYAVSFDPKYLPAVRSISVVKSVALSSTSSGL
ncbi:hypothetical protein H4R33_001978 [Dimargaris cristalligena]|nr:hypothetical protein H4R33_001978 [Dimargaris cristalligena]